MAALAQIVEFLDRELRTDQISDYSGAYNGLQLAHEGPVERIVAAVDASLSVIEKAAALGSGTLLLVHHGMFWQGVQPLTGPFYRKIKVAMEANMAIYSSHLPLDLHPQWGNNACLAQSIGVQSAEPYFEFKGQAVGICGRWVGSRDELRQVLESKLLGPVHVCPGGSDRIERVAVITGGAGSQVAEVAKSGVDAFITGEGPHWSYPLAEELGLNVFYGGHYATETFGVKVLAEVLGKQFNCPWDFVDHPTGL